MEKDHELIKLYQNGNQTAYDRLVRRYLSNTVGFFYTITRDKMVAEDLAQDVFFKLFKSLKNFKFQSAFSTYLYRTNLNTVNSWFTRNKWKRFLSDNMMARDSDFQKVNHIMQIAQNNEKANETA